MKKALALMLALAILFAFASCASKKADVETTVAAEDNIDETVLPDGSEVTITEDTQTEESTGEAITDEDASTEEESSSEAKKKPETKAEILAAYTEAMDYVKKVHPGFKKLEYQNLPEDKRHFSNETILKIAANFMTSKEKATKNPEIREKGYDGDWFPVYHSPKGCLLTDVSALKSAKCEELSGGRYKITLVLNPELNPEPASPGATKAPSNVGSVFGPVSKKEIDDTLNNNKLITVFLKSVTYSLKYYDSTAILVYNPENNHIEKLEQYNHVLITADANTVVGNIKGDAVLDNSMICTEFKY